MHLSNGGHLVGAFAGSGTTLQWMNHFLRRTFQSLAVAALGLGIEVNVSHTERSLIPLLEKRPSHNR